MSDENLVEVERKWRLLSDDNAAGGGVPMEVFQAYVITSPGELRIRRIDGWLDFITVKGDGTISRDEWEDSIPEWVFNQLLLSASGSVEKVRRRIVELSTADRTVEWDVFTGAHEGLQLVESEWIGQKDQKDQLEAVAAEFVLPEQMFGPYVEVTADKRYKNKNLAMAGEIPSL